MITTHLLKKDKTLESNISRAQMLAALKDRDSLLWVDLEAPTEFESDCLVEIFNFHDLAIEDCLSDHSQPKVDDYEEYLFLVVHAASIVHDVEKEQDELRSKELEIFFGRNYVVTFHKNPLKTISLICENVKRKPERYMGHGSDTLVHAILDNLVDNYQPILDLYDEKIDKLEEEIFNNPPADYLSTVMQLKQDIFNLRRIVSPQRDLINTLIKDPEPFIKEERLMYFRDIYDHLFRIYGITESFHENLSSILQAYFSYSSHKLNEVVKHMTVLATLSMPAFIIASIYGMNFDHMPELHWKFGYPFSIGLSLSISLIMLGWMKFKKWL